MGLSDDSTFVFHVYGSALGFRLLVRQSPYLHTYATVHYIRFIHSFIHSSRSY